MKFTPHPDIKMLPADTVAKWADELDVSVQHKGSLCNAARNKFCCLGVLEVKLNPVVTPTDFFLSDGSAVRMPGGIVDDKCLKFEHDELGRETSIGFFNAAIDEDGIKYKFWELNDQWLNHKQIAMLLRGQTVEV